MSRQIEIGLACLLLLAMFVLQIGSVGEKAMTYDEGFYITCGYAFVKLGDLHTLVGEPILLNALNALPLLALPDLRFPTDHPSWADTDFHAISEQFMWQLNDNADQILFLARVPTMLLSLLLAAFVYRWAREAFGRLGGMLALLVCVFDPNLLAHGRLAATDFGATALMFIATYWIWKLLRRPSWRHVLLSGLFFGLAQASRFSALLFGPAYALLFVLRVFVPQPFALSRKGRSLTGQSWGRRLLWLVLAGLLVVLIGCLVIWAVHGFEIGLIRGKTAFPVPAPSYFDEFFYISERVSGKEGRQGQGFLRGELYVGGRASYFPVAFLLKTPLPTLLLCLTGLALYLSEAVRQDTARARIAWLLDKCALWLPPLLYFLIALGSKLNLGYRYILPVVPFAAAWTGQVGQWWGQHIPRLRGRQRAMAMSLVALFVGWTVWSGTAIYPHYLAFFNEVVGGPDNGWRFLVDSNLDWGQDLEGLKRWMDENGVQRVKLGYMGEAPPPYYEIAFDPLPSLPDRWQHPHYHDLYPGEPAPGIYAISATLLQGVGLAEPDMFAWFRQREPIEKIGYSIFIYDVPARGDKVTIALSGLGATDIDAADYARLGTNDVRVLWFDARRAMVWPAEKTAWFVSKETPLDVKRLSLEVTYTTSTRDGRPLQVLERGAGGMDLSFIERLAAASPAWHLAAGQFAPGDPALSGTRLSLPLRVGPLDLLAYEYQQEALAPGGELVLSTYWRVREAAAEPLKLFVHLLDAGGAYSGGEDRLDVWYDNWQAGDMVVQVHKVGVEAEARPGEYQVELGGYVPRTMQRLPVYQDGAAIADRVLLRAVQIDQE